MKETKDAPEKCASWLPDFKKQERHLGLELDPSIQESSQRVEFKAKEGEGKGSVLNSFFFSSS